MRIVTLSLAVALAATSGAALAAGSSPPPSFTLTTPTYTQDFNTLATTGTSQSLPAGFQIVEFGTGAAADGSYAAGTGSSNAGNAYSFGAAGSTERALGSLGSGGVTPIYFGGIVTNGLGGMIQSLAFDYTGEQWRAGTSTDDRLDFQFSLNATEVGNGTWMNIDSLDFLPLVLAGNMALDGTLAANQRLLAGTTGPLAIANGQRFGFRWLDVNSSGSDHGLGVDDFRLTATLAPVAGAVPEPGTWALLILGFGAVGASLRRRQMLAYA